MKSPIFATRGLQICQQLRVSGSILAIIRLLLVLRLTIQYTVRMLFEAI